MHRTLLVGLFALILAACAGQTEPVETLEPTTVVVPTTVPTSIPPTATPTPIPPTRVPEPTATAEPVRSQIKLENQTVGDDGIVRVEQVISAEDGWLKLTSGDIELVTLKLYAGTTNGIEIDVDPLLLGSTLTARLFAGEGDAFDPSIHQIAMVDGIAVEALAAIELQIITPQVVMLKQEVFEDGIIIAESLVATEAGWLAIHSDANGALGEMVGFYVVRGAGVYAQIPIPIIWRLATPTLHAVLYADGGEIGRFEPASDPIIEVQGLPVQTSFSVTYPPDIYILNQPVISNTVTIERVISDGPGWVTIMFETPEETPGNIIGFAPLQNGVNENIVVDIVPGASTNILYAQLHQDGNPVGEFDFPGGDMPAQHNDQVHTFPFNTDEGNYVVSANQPVQYEGGVATINVPMTVSDLAIWVVVRAELAEGVLGDVLGYTWRDAGIHRDVSVEIDVENATETVYVTLHIDRDQLQVFEFPDGRDFELQRRRAPIASPFTILP
ncbi:MAG: DUF7282 domain-containing protein [Candidatus Promineifilaceae bacterium]